MKRMFNKQPSSITHLFIYALAFLILWEWLRPIPSVTNTGQIEVFVWFALFSAAMIYLRVNLVYMIPSLLIGSIYGLHYIFNNQAPFLSRDGGIETVKYFLSDFLYNFQLMFTWQLSSLTPFFRTFLLFLLLGLICYLLYFWIFHTRKIFFFLLASIIYITVLDTFTVVDASMAIIRVVVIGFFMMTLLHMLKIQDEEKEVGRRSNTFISSAWMYTLIFMILIATSVGYAAPKFEPQWADPVPTFKQYVLGESGTGTGTRRVGYGENDERLGGGFVQDFGTVFYAEVEEPSYWRGESKHEYTGFGWTNEPVMRDSYAVFEEEIDYYMFRDSVEVDELEVTITMGDGVGFNHLFYPGQLTSYDTDAHRYAVNGDSGSNAPLTFMTDVNAGKIIAQTANENDDVSLIEYTLSYDNPSFSINALQNDPGDDPESIRELYLQLPEDLPDRIGDLAEEIVEGYDNRYDQVVAVEQYFSRNGFEYRTTDVPIPEEGQDYVDQFLFETQYGYCDNYSTAMAVLLRTLDIPTRWVKGFTEGEEIDTLEDGVRRYEISNSNAHSWVEVFFPEVGWVPFEPTQGFDNNVEFYEEREEIEIDIDTDRTNDENDTPSNDRDPLVDFGENDDDFSSSPGSGSDRERDGGLLSTSISAKSFWISLIVILFVFLAYRKQNIIQNKYFLLRYRLIGNDETFKSAYQRLLWILSNEGLPREEDETLREYAIRIDRMLNSGTMSQLTRTYEKLYYGGQVADGEWDRNRSSWEEIVKLMNS
ncbi:transglutaminase domain-containing protein [Evansella sp. AB-P1]|uniref:DUF4129 domain-containing transglutaminase family protein n=1 Tax=Evansella sp. AB-P1 TaxID=3037653 RepID=UPI00241D302E|nr:transglutaminase domain-containing protein [Evansella sp. AB-P1]MDG5785917.1 transglutaminase domain-containing protein [Evansella sp. AB-P1]